MRLLASLAGRALWLLDYPRLITRLTPQGSSILLESFLSGRPAPTVSWGAQNLHIFVVASLALVLAVRAGGWVRIIGRLAGASLLILLYTLALTLVQLKTVTERFAQSSLQMTVTTHAEKLFLNWSNRGMIMVGMIALPALLFLFTYLSSWNPPGTRKEPAPKDGREGRRDRGLPRRWAVRAAASALALAVIGIGAVFPPPPVGPEETLSGLQRVLSLNPASPQAHFSLALQLEDQGKLGEARVEYETALKLNADQVAAWFNLGNVLFRQGEFREAVRCYEEAIRRDTRHVGARNNLGNALFRLEAYQQAAEAFEAALAIDGGRANAHKNLGETLLRLGRPCDALSHLARSASLDGKLAGDRDLGLRIARLRADCPGN